MNGQMKEARDRCAVFKHLEIPDFARLCQFAYTGDYTSPKPGVDESRSKSRVYQHYQPSQIPTNKSCYCSGCGRSHSCYRQPQPKFNQIVSSFAARNYSTAKIQGLQASYSVPTNSNNEQLDFGPSLLCHAVLYVFGEEYDIPDLKSLAIFKLHKVLQAMCLWESCLKDIITLIAFVYENTKDGSTDPLRELVTEYAVKEHAQLGSYQEFRELLVECAEFTADYLKLS
jgi:hypothetical protein